MEEHGVTDIHHEGKKIGGTVDRMVEVTFERLLKYATARDTVAVYKVLVLDPGSGSNRRKRMLERFDQLEAVCGRIWQLHNPGGSGVLDNTTRRSRDKMRDGAVDDLARSLSAEKAGRPFKPLTKLERDAIAVHWRSADHATDAAAIEAMHAMPGTKRLSVSVIHKNFGKSGRPYRVKKPKT
jgi:hypothetical protein